MQVLTPGGETLVAPHRHRRSQERGWHCVRDSHPHRAPCALVPRWWNVLAKLRWEWQSYPLWANKRRRLERVAVVRRHHYPDGPDRAHLHHRTPRRQHVFCTQSGHGWAEHPAAPGLAWNQPQPNDAAAQANPRTAPPRPHQPGTTRENRTHRRRRTTTPSLACRELRTTTFW